MDLGADDMTSARRSRDYLEQQIASLAATSSRLPRLDAESNPFVASGSFSRRTKIQPLDDIDFFVVLDRTNLGLSQSFWDEYRYFVAPKRGASGPLVRLTNDDEHISSTRVLNLLKNALASVPNYSSAAIHRNGEAVSLKLSSYDWVFDIVPAIPHRSWWTGRLDWYLMPNARGDWMRSDPRRDAERMTLANRRHNGLLLPLVRLIKYWNERPICPVLPSYYIETLCWKVFEGRSPIATVQEGLQTFFRKAPAQVRTRCSDPKGLGHRLDRDIDWQTKESVEQAMGEAAWAARDARRAERSGDVASALEAWRRVFGAEFPRFGH